MPNEKYPTEGYISDRDLFNKNKIMFLLREPNSNGEKAKVFWMKEVINGNAVGRHATKYKNRLTELVEALGLPGDEIKNAVYTNINPDGGTNQVGETYRSLSLGNRAKQECERYKPAFVFTCKDIFEAMWIKYDMPERKNGILYHRGGADIILDRFQTADGITVFAIYHPSFSPRLPKQNLLD